MGKARAGPGVQVSHSLKREARPTKGGRTARLLTWGGERKVQESEKGTGSLPEPQMGDLPRNNSQDHRLAVLCRTGLDSHGDRLETHEGHWAVGTWVRVGAHAGRTRALWCHILSAHKLHLSSGDVMRNVCPLLFPLELGSEHVYQCYYCQRRKTLPIGQPK